MNVSLKDKAIISINQTESEYKKIDLNKIIDRNTSFSMFQRLKLKIFGNVLLFKNQIPKISQEISVYAFKCNKHGLQFGTPSGWSLKLFCPKCFAQLRKEKK